ncbi:MAG: ATP-binding protein [Desulfomonilaceae bacterium]
MVTGKKIGALFCEMMESILIIDSFKGTILWTNPCACVTFAFQKEEFVGQHFTCLFPRGSEIEAANVLNEVVCADGVFVTQSFMRKDGNILYMDLTASLIPWEGESTAILAVLREASERKEFEELRLESERLRSFSELSAGVAHHFNNMLQVIIGFAGLAKSELATGATSSAMRKLEQIIVSSTSAATAIQGLQNFARCGQPMDFLCTNVVNLKLLTQKALELVKLWWETRPEKHKIVISIETELDQDCHAKVNQEQILEVMINLIKNAFESLEQSGVVRIGVKNENGDAVFYVKDSGIGITKVDLKKIFDPFWTTKGPRAKGLGLAGALGIVKQNGGEIVVDSTEGMGSTFKVKFPLIQPSVKNEEGLVPKNNVRELTVLIIDGDPKVIETLSAGLTHEVKLAHTASTIERGLSILDNIDVDIIISDEDVHGKSGWDFARELKRRYVKLNRKKPCLILLTTWGIEETVREKMSKTGVDLILAKPVTIEKLIHHIRENFSKTPRVVD